MRLNKRNLDPPRQAPHRQRCPSDAPEKDSAHAASAAAGAALSCELSGLRSRPNADDLGHLLGGER